MNNRKLEQHVKKLHTILCAKVMWLLNPEMHFMCLGGSSWLACSSNKLWTWCLKSWKMQIKIRT